MNARLAVSFLFVVVVSAAPIANAQWVPYGVPVSGAAGDQTNFKMIPDGAGGAIVAWTDYRGTSNDIYAQRIDAFGAARWTLDGVAVCTQTGDQGAPVLVSDGAGGCIIAWNDDRTGGGDDVYAQRISGAGVAQWTANGVVISAPATGAQWAPTITADGSGGAIIAWQDSRNGPDDIYAQRVNSAGVVQWAANGKSVCVAAGAQQAPRIVTDGAGGAIVTWMDYRSGTSYDIYAQRMSSAGTQSWVAGGVGVCTVAGQQAYPEPVSDAAGGAIIVWQDSRGATPDIFVQRVTSAGAMLWTAQGVPVCTASNEQYAPVITTDGASGCIVAWTDYRVADGHIYARRVSAAGVAVWQADGVPVCTAAGGQLAVAIASDNAGGAVLTWTDQRAVYSEVYAQRLRNTGLPLWDIDGVAVNDRLENTYEPSIVTDGANGGIVAWRDQRNGLDDIYAQRVEGRFGAWGHPEPTVTSVADVRPDQGGHVKVNWKASGADGLGFVALMPVTYYTVWRATDAVAALASSDGRASALVVRDPSEIPDGFTGKAIYIQGAPATDYYWELVGTQTALKIPAYSFSAETRADSVLGNTATHHFMVAGHANEYVTWPSNEMSGHSVDNLAPPAPIYLTAYRAGSSVVLKWNRVRVPDLRDYSIYRQGTTGVTPIDPNFLDSTDDSTLVDTSAPTTALYYIVTANDVHANRSAPSNEAAVSPSTGANEMPPITGLTVMQNRPNPFNGRATFDIGLPAASRIDMEVFDIAGRRVASRALGTKPAGWQTITLDAIDESGAALPSGVYFYRIRAAGQEITRKMVIAR